MTLDLELYLRRQMEKYDYPNGRCRVCGEAADYVHRWNGRAYRFCIDHDQEPPEDD